MNEYDEIYEHWGGPDCPMDATLELIGRKWVVAIIRDMYVGKKHFSQFKENKPNLTNSVLSDTLKFMVEMDLIENSLYLRLKYGTDVDNEIILIKNGISLSLATLIIDKYSKHITIDAFNDTVHFNGDIIEEMKQNKENEILIYEVQNNIFD